MSSFGSYRHLSRVHEAQSEVVFLYDVQVVHDLVEELLTFGFFLRRETSVKSAEHSFQGKRGYPAAISWILLWRLS